MLIAGSLLACSYKGCQHYLETLKTALQGRPADRSVAIEVDRIDGGATHEQALDAARLVLVGSPVKCRVLVAISDIRIRPGFE